jgi:hypothetical protein
MTTGLALADSYHKRTKLADKEATSFAATASSSPAHATACARANRGRNDVDMTALEDDVTISLLRKKLHS